MVDRAVLSLRNFHRFAFDAQSTSSRSGASGAVSRESRDYIWDRSESCQSRQLSIFIPPLISAAGRRE